LKTLPDLSNFVKLEELICFQNVLKTLPDLSKCVNLKVLNCFNNNFEYDEMNSKFKMQDLSKCVNLEDVLSGAELLPDYSFFIQSIKQLKQDIKSLQEDNKKLREDITMLKENERFTH
jgi:hypothetical protein